MLITVPVGSTKVSDSRVLYVLSSVPQAMPEELLATTPPMVQADSLAGSAELAVAQAQPSINLAHRRTRLDAHALALIQYLDAAEVLAHVHQVTIARGLAGKGRAARAQGYRNILLSARTEDGGHVLGGASLDDCLGVYR